MKTYTVWYTKANDFCCDTYLFVCGVPGVLLATRIADNLCEEMGEVVATAWVEED